MASTGACFVDGIRCEIITLKWGFGIYVYYVTYRVMVTDDDIVSIEAWHPKYESWQYFGPPYNGGLLAGLHNELYLRRQPNIISPKGGWSPHPTNTLKGKKEHRYRKRSRRRS